MSVKIQVDGLRQFTRALKQLDTDLPKMVRIALNDAAQLVIDEALPHVPKRTGKAARSMRGQSTRNAVRVTEGGNRAPYMPWLDFGGRVGRKKATRRAFSPDGRFLYPAYFRLRDDGSFVDVMSEALVDVARSAGVEID